MVVAQTMAAAAVISNVTWTHWSRFHPLAAVPSERDHGTDAADGRKSDLSSSTTKPV